MAVSTAHTGSGQPKNTPPILTVLSSWLARRTRGVINNPLKGTAMILSRTLLMSCCLAIGASVWAEDKKITLDQLPAAVKAAALKQANGVAISEIEEETKKGKTVYEVKFGDTEVTFDANGTVLSSKVEKDDEEEDEDEEDEEDEDEDEDDKKADGKKADGDKAKKDF